MPNRVPLIVKNDLNFTIKLIIFNLYPHEADEKIKKGQAIS